MKRYIGVDLGGTNIKVALVDDGHQILIEKSRPTLLPRPAEDVCADIVAAIRDILSQAKLTAKDVCGGGIGCPGTVDGKRGVVSYSNNLAWRDVDLAPMLERAIGCPFYLENDANTAALGEARAGSAKGAESAVIVTLGTGVGSGIVIGGRLHAGYSGTASEFGHMVIVRGGERCTCGREGCLESYASATGLIRMTWEAMRKNANSRLWTLASSREEVNGRTAFEGARLGDETARRVVDLYIDYLACGAINIVNALQPEILSLGGGIAKEGETLLRPLREKVYAEIFGGRGRRYTRIEQCTLGYKAGLIGAAILAEDNAGASR
ncbi:MAG: ROK family protein [Oscillospiraceae bacterium]|jgi:glucokinase|nr:ROK family protein [Oscillospiraceae bacterium]